ncbi:MAG: insulinase family protein [Alphaproteobacteria bacterium]|nr:insulinase family protein [Alphaproteobacteria bacterium]
MTGRRRLKERTADADSGIAVTTLPSGLRVVSSVMAHVETASVGVWVDAGARYETREMNGVAHLLEHMAFKGTERRTARGIAEEIESVGGHINAYTAREHTAYYARVLKEDVPLAVDLLADILQHSTFHDAELERERTVVIQEIGQARDTPDDEVFDLFQETAFPGQSLGRSILGTADGVAAMPRRALIDYMSGHYRAPRMVVVGAGKVDHDRLVELASAGFASLPGASASPLEPARYVGGDFRAERPLEQVHLVLGFPGVAYHDPDFYAKEVLSVLLGGGMSSRLFQEVREERGLAYSIFSFASSYVDGGLFGVYAGTGAEQVATLLPVVCDEILKATSGITAAEVNRARAQIKAGVLMSLESSSSRGEQLARQMLVFGRPIPTAEIIERIEAVDGAAVQRVLQRILAAGQPTLVGIGPVAEMPDYGQVLARLQ